MSIRLFVTGGTFDKIYDGVEESLTFKRTHIYEILENVKNKSEIKVETLMLIDSLDMNEEHRNEILKKCKSCQEDKIIITHGTSTMAETAKLLGKEINDKSIILTGAMLPYSIGKGDAIFNLGFALASVQTIPKGIYIAMNGKIFHYDNVRKNSKNGEFENIK